jgi:hypothetical protein
MVHYLVRRGRIPEGSPQLIMAAMEILAAAVDPGSPDKPPPEQGILDLG